jgi:hypothetical protein
MTYYIGIDQGMTGAIAALDNDGTLEECWDIPSYPKGGGAKGNEYDLPAMMDIFQYEVLGPRGGAGNCYVATEMVMFANRGDNAPGMWQQMMLARSQGLWEGILAANRVPHELIRAQEWKKTFSLTAKGPAGKELSRQKALQIWGGTEWFRNKGHHNRAEAALIAEHIRRVRGRS